MFQIIAPNLRGAILSASVITVALVLGEFTISSLLNYDTLQVVINLLGKRDAFVAVAVSLAALLFAFVLILGIAIVGRGAPPTGRRTHRRRRSPDDRSRPTLDGRPRSATASSVQLLGPAPPLRRASTPSTA